MKTVYLQRLLYDNLTTYDNYIKILCKQPIIHSRTRFCVLQAAAAAAVAAAAAAVAAVAAASSRLVSKSNVIIRSMR